MNTKFSAISRIGLVSLGLWIAGPACAQSTIPGYTTGYLPNAYLDYESNTASNNPGGSAQYPSGQYPSGQYASPQSMVSGPGGVQGPGYMGTGAGSGWVPGALMGGAGGGMGAGGAGMGAGGAGMGAGGAGMGAGGDGTAPGAPGATTTPGAAAEAASTFSPAEGGVLSGSGSVFAMIGDQAPMTGVQTSRFPQPPFVPNPKLRSQIVPAVRGFKIADNQSPFPQDRIYFTFNYFDNVNARLNSDFKSPISSLSVFRYVFGGGEDVLAGDRVDRVPASPGFGKRRYPCGNCNQGGTSTALNDLTIFLKYILAYNRRRAT